MGKTNLLMSKFNETIKLQEKFNSKVDNNWKEKNFNWSTCIFVELGEMLASTGYKHWKKEEADVKNIKMEVVDVYHFIISECLQKVHNEDNQNKYFKLISKGLKSRIKSYGEYAEELEFDKQSILKLTIISTDVIRFSVLQQDVKDSILFLTRSIIDLIHLVFSGNFDEFLNLYFAKNALNSFRQNNGYKDGTYQKVWDGKEDNEHVAMIVEKNIALFNEGSEFNAELFIDKVNGLLELSYHKSGKLLVDSQQYQKPKPKVTFSNKRVRK